MVRTLAQALPYVIAGLFGLAVLLFLISLQQLRRGRTGSYWRLRRQAGQRGGQLFLVSIGLFGLALAITLFSGLADVAYQKIKAALENNDPNVVHGVALSSATPASVETVTPPASQTATAPPTATAQPDTATAPPTASATPTLIPSASSIPTLTLTPSATFENILALTPPTSAVQPSSKASVEITNAALEVATDGTPINPGNAFTANAKRIYLFIQFHDMTPGVSLTRILYREGIPIQGQSYLWSLEASGNNYFFFGADEGYPAGHYEVKLFVGQTEVSQYTFSLN